MGNDLTLSSPMEFNEILYDELPANTSTLDSVIPEVQKHSDPYKVVTRRETAQCFSMWDDYAILNEGTAGTSVSNEKDFMDELEMIKNNSHSTNERFERPSVTSILLSELFVNDLVKHDLPVSRISPSAEGGISFVFQDRSRALYLEIYNDGEVGYIIEDFRKRTIIDNKEIQLSQAVKTVQDFFENE